MSNFAKKVLRFARFFDSNPEKWPNASTANPPQRHPCLRPARRFAGGWTPAWTTTNGWRSSTAFSAAWPTWRCATSTAFSTRSWAETGRAGPKRRTWSAAPTTFSVSANCTPAWSRSCWRWTKWSATSWFSTWVSSTPAARRVPMWFAISSIAPGFRPWRRARLRMSRRCRTCWWSCPCRFDIRRFAFIGAFGWARSRWSWSVIGRPSRDPSRYGEVFAVFLFFSWQLSDCNWMGRILFVFFTRMEFVDDPAGHWDTGRADFHGALFFRVLWNVYKVIGKSQKKISWNFQMNFRSNFFFQFFNFLSGNNSSAIYQSINQSIREKAPTHSINQSIHNLLLFSIDSTNQSINLSIPWHFKHTQSINQLTAISKSVFFLNCRGLQVLIVFSSFWLMRKVIRSWDGVGDTGEGWTEPGGLGFDRRTINTPVEQYFEPSTCLVYQEKRALWNWVS